MSFDLNITVNGSRCKQYAHQGKTFIEAKQGSEYVVEIKNNYWKRVLAVGSVDGLNVLTGKTANENDSGYIVGGYSAEKIKGFRFSDDEWALFKFGYKFSGNTYAQSKEDGSEKNCGVIGIKFFYEKEPIVTTTTYSTNYPTYSYYNNSGTVPNSYYATNVNYQSNNLGETTLDFDNDFPRGRSGLSSGLAGGNLRCFGDCVASVNYCASIDSPVACASSDSQLYVTNDIKVKKPEFDMGTEWGRKEKSKVKNVDFERGSLAQTFNIYYASREALIAMGVPITNELSINLPQSFPDKYATPPKNWVG